MPTAKPGPWLDQAIAKGLLTNSSAVQSSALDAVASGGTGVALSAIPEDISEVTWQNLVVSFAEHHGWKAAHCTKRLVKVGKKQWWETTMPKGWFDLFLARPGSGCHFVELKVKINTRTKEQMEWASIVMQSGGNYHCWYPKDWSFVQEALR